MAFVAGEGVIRLSSDVRDSLRGLDRVRAKLRSLGGTFQQIGKISRRFLLGQAVALAGVLKLAGEQEKAEEALRAALARTGDATDANIAKFKKFASEIQRVTVFGDELILSQIAMAKNLGVNTDQLEEATRASVGLAKIIGKDLKTAFLLVARAAVGDTASLKRYGLTIDATLSPQEKFNAVLRIGTAGFVLAEAEAKTFTGRLSQLKNAVLDIGESIGFAFVPKIKELSERIRGVLPDLDKWVKENQDLILSNAILALKIAGVGAALGVLVVGIKVIATLVLGFKGLLAAISFVFAATTALGISLTATFAVIAIPLAGIIAALILVNKEMSEAQERINALTQGEFEQLQTGRALLAARKELNDLLVVSNTVQVGTLQDNQEMLKIAQAQLKASTLDLKNKKLIQKEAMGFATATDLSGEIQAQLAVDIEKQKQAVKELTEIVTAQTAAESAAVVQAEKLTNIKKFQATIEEKIRDVRRQALQEEGSFESRRLLLIDEFKTKMIAITKLQKKSIEEFGDPLTKVFEKLRAEQRALSEEQLANLKEAEVEAKMKIEIDKPEELEARPAPRFLGLFELQRRITEAGAQKAEAIQRKINETLNKTLKTEEKQTKSLASIDKGIETLPATLAGLVTVG